MASQIPRTLLETEQDARSYLVSLCWPDGHSFCPRCGHEPVYRLKTGRLRCKACAYTFQDFTGRRLGEVHLPCLDWLALIASFVRETAPAEAAAATGVSYNTARKAYHAMRLALTAGALDAPQILPVLGRKAGAPGTGHSVLGIIEKSGLVFVDLVPDIDAQTLLIFKHNFRLRTAALGGVVYTDRYRHYDALIASAAAFGDAGGPHRDQALFVETGHGFWSFVSPRLKSRRGIGPAELILYFKELEFRYNNRDRPLDPLIAGLLCARLGSARSVTEPTR
jgi:transposase